MSQKRAHDLKCCVAESEPTVERLRDWVYELADIVERLAGANLALCCLVDDLDAGRNHSQPHTESDSVSNEGNSV